jgi:hypothetical protein
MYHFYFPEEFIELSKEIAKPNHEKLHQLLANNTDPIIRFGIIAAYCNVAMDDMYTEEDLKKIAHILLVRLRAMKTIIVFPSPSVSVIPPESNG